MQQALGHFHARRLGECEAICRRVLRDEPRNPHAAWLMANTLARLSQHEQALYFAKIAAEASPHSAERVGMYLACLNQGKDRALAVREAERVACDGVIGGHVLVLDQLAKALKRADRIAEALRVNQRIAATNASANVMLQVAGDLSSHGWHRAAQELMDRALAMETTDPRAPSNPCFSANAWSHISARELFERHLEIGRRFARFKPLDLGPLTNRPDAGRQIRLGYMTGDAKQHSVSYFLDALLRYPDRKRFKVHLYANVRTGDAVTKKFAEMADVHRVLTGLEEAAAAALMRKDQIDILVDLSGLTSGSGVWMMRSRVAPIQATYLGYCNTTGLAGVDVRLIDEVTDPPGWADALATERLVRIPGCFVCYRPPEELGAVTWEPASVRGARGGEARVVFGCFNALHKLSERTYDLWAEVLRAVPGSVLLLKTRPLADVELAGMVRGEFARRGVADVEDRVLTVGRTEKASDHLGMYNRVDVALDPTPYGGTTTTCEALVMGVPVVTLAGDRHAARVGASLNRAVGHPELVAENAGEYVRIASELARDEARLTTLRRGLREEMLGSMLCDGPGFMRRLEGAYVRLWEEWCAGAAK
jgi:predicted O-linked N-acetylglucosamine transferase (SPINDLY family)